MALINLLAIYFDSEEAMRNVFFSTCWSAPSTLHHNETLIIGTTINPSIYKGLDLIDKILKLLKDYDICWKIFGETEHSYLIKVVKKISKSTAKGRATLHFYGSVGSDVLIKPPW